MQSRECGVVWLPQSPEDVSILIVLNFASFSVSAGAIQRRAGVPAAECLNICQR